MRRLVLLLPLFLLLWPVGGAATSAAELEGWYAFDGGPRGAAAEVLAVTPVEAGLDLSLSVLGLETGTIQTKAGPRGVLLIPGGGVSGETGHPRLPVLRYLIEVPPGASIELKLAVHDSSTLRLSELGVETLLMPVQAPVPKIEGAAALAPFAQDAVAYARDEYLPAERVAVVGRAVLRGRHVAQVEVRPVRYNPVTGTVEVWSRAELKIRFEGGLERVARRDKGRLASRPMDDWLEREIQAPTLPPQLPAAPNAGGASEGALGMVVVAHDSFVDAIQPLLDWKRKTGYKVDLVRTTDLGANPTDGDVKAAIQLRYGLWSAPPVDFILIVGDTDFVPIHQGSGGGNSQVTDNWYACLDGTDYLPDVAIARISTRTGEETADVVEKLLTYEQATFPTDDWIKDAGFIGTLDSGYIGLIEGTHDWCIDSYYTPNGYQPTPWSYGYPSCDRHYNTNDADTAEIAASIDAGRSIVNYSGHGGDYSWQGPTSHGGYDQSDIRNNTNDGMYPFIISNACVTGSLADAECFGETWQKVPRAGAIAFWGASNNSYWDEDDVLERDLHGNIFPMDATPPIGVIVNETKLDLYDYYGDAGTVAYYFDMYNLLSEPSLSLWTRAPRTLEVTYPQAAPIGESSFSVSVTSFGAAIEGALVAVLKDDEQVFEAGYTDASGAVTLILDPAPQTVGTLQVTVTGHDCRPFEGGAEIIAPDSPWLIHRSHSVDDATGGDGDGAANPGEEMRVSVTVENVGEQPALDVQATLTTSTPQWCEVHDGSAGFPDMAPHTLGTSLPDHFLVRVLPEAPDGVLLGLDMQWTAAGGAAGTTAFNERVEAVELALDTFEILDLPQGNGNGVAGPGETVEMTVTLANIGHRDAVGVTGVLSTESPYISVVQAEAGHANIPAGGTGSSEPPQYSFAVAVDAPDQQPVTFTLTMTESGSGYVDLILFDVLISSCSITSSVDVPKPIDDNATVESLLHYAHDVLIEDLDVFVNIAHTYQGDLTVTLVSPEGTSCVLHDRTGSGTDDIVTWYDDETEPAEPLSVFVGESAYGNWTLIVTDSAGSDTGSLDEWKLEICGEGVEPVPLLSVCAREVDDSGACDPDGVADVGETVLLDVTVRNSGRLAATGVQATLESPNLLAVLTDSVALPDLDPGAEAVAVFPVLIGAVGCLEQASFTVELRSNEGAWFDGFDFVLEADLEGDTSLQTLEPWGFHPMGWSHTATAGMDDWRVVSDRNHTPAGQWSWFASSSAELKDDRLVSPPYELTGSPSLEFWHWIELQGGYDGGVIEITDDAGENWTDLSPQIVIGSYDRELAGDNPIAGRHAWTGSFDSWRRVLIDLAPWGGRTVQFRWRLVCDAANTETGWWIDDIAVHLEDASCDAHPCGVPGEVLLTAVSKNMDDVLLEWGTDPVCLDFRVWRSSDPHQAGSYVDVTMEDPDPSDASFLDTTGGSVLYWIIQGHGPDGDGPWGHYGQ